MPVDFIKNPAPDVAPIKLDFYKPETVEVLTEKIVAGQVIAPETKLEDKPEVPVFSNEEIIKTIVQQDSVEDDSGMSPEVVEALKG